MTGFSYDFERRAQQAEVWRDFLTRVQAIRQTGSAALNLCYIAAGRLDGYWERGISPWDVAAGAVIVTEAGGTVTNMRGGLSPDDREFWLRMARYTTICSTSSPRTRLHPGDPQLGS